MTTIDTRTEAERRYDAERDGSLYFPQSVTVMADVQASAIPYIGISISPGAGAHGNGGMTLTVVPTLAIHDDVPTIGLEGEIDPEYLDDPEPPTSFGPQRVHEIVRLERRGLVILDAEREVFVMTDAEYAAQTGSVAKLSPLRAAARADGYDDGYMAAVRALAAEPELHSQILAERFVCDDDLDERFGQEIGTDYTCGKVTIHFPDNGRPASLLAFGVDIEPDMLERDLGDLVALMNDPRVKAERERAK